MFDLLKLFNRKKIQINTENIKKLAEPYVDNEVYYCGFDYIKNGSFFSSGKNVHDQAIIVFKKESIKIMTDDGKVVEFDYGGFSTYTKAQQIVFSNNDEDVIVCWSFLTIQQLSKVVDPDTKNIYVLEDEINSNIKNIESIILTRGGRKVEVNE